MRKTLVATVLTLVAAGLGVAGDIDLGAGPLGPSWRQHVAHAGHGTMPRPHWHSEHRHGIKVYNRAASPYVAEAIARLNEAAQGRVSFDPDVIAGGDPNDCSPPPTGTVAVCWDRRGNPYAAAGGGDHLAWCVVGLAWDGFPVVAHELGHCLGLGHHGPPWGSGIMGGEEKVTHVDVEALAEIYGHVDAPPSAGAAPSPPPSPASPSAYSCAGAANVTPTSARIGAITSDPRVSSARFEVFGTTGYPAHAPVTSAGPPFVAELTNLSPATTYTFTVTFDGGHRPAGGAHCSFTTPWMKGPWASASPAGGPPSAPPAPTAANPRPPYSGRICLLVCL